MRVVVRRAHSRINLVTLPWEVRGLEARQRGKRKAEGGVKEVGSLFLKVQPRQPSATFEFFSIYK
jgi:hypothetical protein